MKIFFVVKSQFIKLLSVDYHHRYGCIHLGRNTSLLLKGENKLLTQFRQHHNIKYLNNLNGFSLMMNLKGKK